MADGHTSRRVEISEDEYLAICEAESQLNHALSVEDKYDVTIQNYFEFESSIVQEAVRDLVGISRGDEASEFLRKLLSRRLSNILSSARLYLDTLLDHSDIVLNSDALGVSRIRDAVHAQYDGSLHYRLAEALRNYSQHHALPVHGLFGPNPSEEMRLDYAIEPFVDPDELREDDKFKKEVLAELPADGEVMKLKPVLRSYIESLGSIQAVFRGETGATLSAIHKLFVAVRGRYLEGFPDEWTLVLAAAPVDDSGSFPGKIVYIEAELTRLLKHMKSNKPSMERLCARRIEF